MSGFANNAKSREAERQRSALTMANRGIVARGGGRALLEADQLATIIQGVIKCAICADKFSALKSPRACGVCSRSICSVDCDDFYLVALIFPGSKHNPCICRTCAAAPAVSKSLEDAKKHFYLSRPVLQEQARLKSFLAAPKVSKERKKRNIWDFHFFFLSRAPAWFNRRPKIALCAIARFPSPELPCFVLCARPLFVTTVVVVGMRSWKRIF